MSPIGVVLDLLVLALLAWALALGLTLNRRLKALREGQADFARAVGELNEAARRAESGLADLRRGAEETLGLLQGRIEAARSLVERLEAASEAASRGPSGPFGATFPRGGGLGKASAPPLEELSAQRTEGARDTRSEAQPAAAGFAEMIRRTLREAR